ncbi:MAG: glycosyltransferase family 4 protein [Desulfobulbaceae bacterium]|nr:glycosyltransferase family 4 protein [Desulfobulbaceae bacterium]
MKILVNSIPMSGMLTGIARYLRSLYAEIAQLDDVEVSFFDGRAVSNTIPALADSQKRQRMTKLMRKLPGHLVFLLRCHRWLRYEQALRKLCRTSRFDLYHETDFVPAKQQFLPAVYSVYDLSLMRFPQTHPLDRVLFFDFFFKRRIQYATHILTISNYIRREIIDYFGIDDKCASFVPLAPAACFTPMAEHRVEAVRSKYHVPVNYLLFAGTIEPRKNIQLLIKALQKIDGAISLVLTGWQGWGEKQWMQIMQETGIAHRVIVTGHIPDSDLAALYNGATAMIYPSLYEGFGLPIIEAMACGCPVICSNTSSMPEVAGDAALLIDPTDVETLRRAIENVLNDRRKRDQLKELGIERARLFSWRETARQTVTLFRNVVKTQ